jgi:hypothetical protein
VWWTEDGRRCRAARWIEDGGRRRPEEVRPGEDSVGGPDEEGVGGPGDNDIGGRPRTAFDGHVGWWPGEDDV